MVQVLAMGTVLAIFAVLQSRLWPWRTRFANFADLGINLGLLLCIMGASFLIDVKQEYGERLLGEFIFVAIMLIFAVSLAVRQTPLR